MLTKREIRLVQPEHLAQLLNVLEPKAAWLSPSQSS
jgi:hypothetical protein